MADTDADINARLAEAIGWSTGSPPGAAIDDWDPLNDIRHAFEVWHKLLGPGYMLTESSPAGYPDGERWWCFLPEGMGGEGISMAPTPARAIALAADAALSEEA